MNNPNQLPLPGFEELVSSGFLAKVAFFMELQDNAQAAKNMFNAELERLREYAKLNSDLCPQEVYNHQREIVNLWKELHIAYTDYADTHFRLSGLKQVVSDDGE